MIIKPSRQDEIKNLKLFYDFLIVGGGTMGIFLTELLRKKYPKKNILVIEAGSEIPETNKNVIGTILNFNKKNYGVNLGRAFGLGGTSSIWGGQLVELQKNDLAKNKKNWPFSYKKLKNLYNEVYSLFNIKHHNKNERGTFLNRWKNLNFKKINNIKCFYTTWLKEPSFVKLFNDSIRSHNVHFLINTHLDNIFFNGKRAYSVSCSTNNELTLNFNFNKIIFASGTIEICKFFLWSKTHNNVPWSNNPKIGTYFQDHLFADVAEVEIYNETKFRNLFENLYLKGVRIQPKLYYSNSNLISPSICGFFNFYSDYSDSISRIKNIFRNFNLFSNNFFSFRLIFDFFKLSRLLIPIILRFFSSSRIYALFDKRLLFSIQIEQIPNSNSRISLYKDSVKYKKSSFILRWNVSGDYLSTAKNFLNEVNTFLKENNIGQIKLLKNVLKNNTVFIKKLRDTYHHAGGMIMSSSELDGCVDFNCKVHNTKNVYISGAAILPNSGFANTTLTALALTLNLSKKL